MMDNATAARDEHAIADRPPLLYLVHRIPFPPNKGDKVRSFHLLQALARRYRVFLGTFVDYKEDWQHVPALGRWCEDVFVAGISPLTARLMSLRGLAAGEALTLPYYRDGGMARWVRTMRARHDIKRAVVFSSSMAQYVADQPGMRRIVDFVDVDSAKWTSYAGQRSGPMAWLYGREGRFLAEHEREVASWADASVLVSQAEADLFRRVAPQAGSRIHAIGNGVDATFFSPVHALDTPYQADEEAVVFTGAMDYWPNIDAALWFGREIWPAIAAARPRARFYVVGMNPSPEVKALAESGTVVVTGTVPDVRPYIRHARAVVAPLRIARGVQNKILEAMAMGRPVIASRTCAGGIGARVGEEMLVADKAGDWQVALARLLDDARAADAMGAHGRQRVLADYSWESHLDRFCQLLEDGQGLASDLKSATRA